MQNDPSTAAIARLSGEFVCATTEASFLRQHSADIVRDVRRALILCSMLYAVFSIIDVLGAGWPAALVPVLSRCSVPLLAYVGLRYMARSATPVRAAYRVSSAFTLLGVTSYLLIVFVSPREVLLHGAAIGLLSVVILIFIPNRLRSACAIAFGASLVFLVLAWSQHLEATLRLVPMTMLVLFSNAFPALAAHRHARLWREQYLTQQVLTNLSVRDPLTGCYNRRHLNAALLDGEIARARRYRLGLSLVMCDLDDFKAVNDTHGHHAGDELLRAFGALLQALTREAVDTVVRYGGEEFLIILPATRLDGAIELAERVRSAFAAQRIDSDGIDVGTTASFGVVGVDFSVGQALTPQALVAAADELMYEAKRSGRNRVHARQLAPDDATLTR